MSSITAVSSSRTSTRVEVSATRFERALLRAAAGLDAFVAARLEARTSDVARAAADTQDRFAAGREAAQARAAVGIMPR